MKYLKYISLTILFFIFLIIFSPKERIFNVALNKLYNNKIVLKTYEYDDSLFSMNIKNAILVYDGIEIAQIQTINIFTLIYANTMLIDSIKLDDSLNHILPSKINIATLKYSVFNPLSITININTSLYKANGYFDFYKKKLYLDVSVSSHFKNTYPKILKKMKYNKNTKGYTYEYSL